MRACYVVVSDGADIHADLAYISARFLRLVHPKLPITCLMDRQSAAAQRASKHPLGSVVDHILEADVPHDMPGPKSRWLKTGMRLLLEGDFLYLDTDTICLRPLDHLLEKATQGSFDLGMARDLNIRLAEKSRRIGLRGLPAELSSLGWSCPNSGFFNTGVILYRDTEEARNQARCWRSLWQEALARGCHQDQPAMNQSLAQSKAKLLVLEPRHNAMVLAAPRTVPSARIMHFFASVPSSLEDTVIVDFLNELTATAALLVQTIGDFIRDPFPWNSPEAFNRLCWSKNRRSAIWILAKRMMHGLDRYPPRLRAGTSLSPRIGS